MKTNEKTTRWLGLALACGTLIFTASAQAGKPVKPPPEPPPPSGPAYRIVALGSLGESSAALAINEAGQAVGQVFVPGLGFAPISVVPEASADGPVYYRDTSPADGINDLMVVLPGLGGEGGFALDVNDDGWVVGDSWIDEPCEWYQQATLWQKGSVINLGYVNDWGSSGYAINNLGQIAVGAFDSAEVPVCIVVPKDTDGDGEPDIWFEDADGDKLNDLLLPVAPCLWRPDGLPLARFSPQGINDAGQMIVNYFEAGTGQLITPDAQDTDGDGNPWFADENGDGFNDLMLPLVGLDDGGSYACDINTTGQVVGKSNGRAVLWDCSSGTPNATDLGLLSRATQSMEATAINDRSQIVGIAYFRKGRTAFLHDSGKLYDLAACLTNGDGWTNLQARDINNQGCIVGHGEINGVQQAFVAIPVTQP